MAYTFKPTQYGTVEVYQDGRRVSTGTPQVAEQYGYNVPVSSVSMSSSLPAPISVSGLSENVQAINPPPAPTDTTDYGAILANTGPIVAPPPPTTEKTEISLIEKYLAGATPPTSQEQAFRTAEEEAGIQAKQQAVLEQQRKEQAARNRLNALNAQLNAISTESKATQERLLEEATGRGITVGGLQPMQASELRKSALAALPIQAQVYGAQADLQAAQGDTEGARQTLALAQGRLDTIFKLKSDDITNTYNYWKDLRDKVFTFATEAEKTKLAAQQKEDDRKQAEQKDRVDNAQAISMKAMENGQAELAAQITQLNPTSPTFTEDLARLQSQIRVKPTEIPVGLGGAENISDITGKPLTEGERLSQGYALRAEQSNEIIEQLGRRFTGIISVGARFLPNIFKSPERQQFEQAQRNFVNAVLRRESGAAIAESEFENARKQYFPQSGDAPAVVKQKTRNRRTVIGTLNLAGGRLRQPIQKTTTNGLNYTITY